MRFAWVVAFLFAWLCLASAVASAADDAPPEAETPLVTSTRQNTFTIPFRIDQPASPREQPVEVQLHVSKNRGENWEVADKVAPEKGSFVYRAPHDGEYWFAIRTVDKQGVARPEGDLQAQLTVHVDTIQPRLDLTATRGDAGQIVASWKAVDPNLKPGSFKLEYQLESGNWEAVSINSTPGAMRHTHSGETTWWPPSSSGTLQVRAEVTDQAGNRAVSQVAVKLPASRLTGNLAGGGANTSRGGDTGVTSRFPGANNALPPSTGLTPSGSQNRYPDPAAMSNGGSPGRPLDSLPSNNSAPPNPPFAANNPPRNSNPPSFGNPPRGESWRSSDPNDGTRWPADRATNEPLGHPPATAHEEATSRSRDPRVPAQTVSQRQPIGRPGSVLDFNFLPRGERPRMVNSQSFELEYDIDSVGPSGIGRVELWGTRDGGRTWSNFAVDNDNRSPITARVEEQGIYGLRVVVQSGSGLGGRPPVAGDQPDIWIGVDLTMPTCKITSADVSDEGEMVVRWDASDDLPEARPITLLFSPTQGGPWTPIASGLENSGSYRWRLDSRLPDRIFLRLESRDEAGNVGKFETPEPTSLDRHRPEGRIRGVRPLGS